MEGSLALVPVMAIEADEGVSGLIDAARAGDGSAFDQLVRIHQRRVTRLAYRFLRDPDQAETVAQEAFLKAWTHLDRFRGDCPFGAWLCRIAANLCRDELKKKRIFFNESSLERDGEPGPLALAEAGDPSPEGHAKGREIGRHIAAAMVDLPRMQREVFSLRYCDDLPLADIAALFRVDVGTVKTHLFRATRKVREALEVHYGNRLPV